MSVIIHTRGEAGGGVAAHLHCSHCGHFSKSHAQQLSHMAASHPTCLDEEVVGRLGNILTYQSTARLFHCSVCFFTCRDFTKLYKHIISKHCMDDREGGGREAGDGGEDEKKMGDGGEEEDEKKMGDGGEEKKKKMGDEGEEEENILTYDGSIYRCLICGCKNKLKVVSVNHVMKKHDIPKAYASQAIRRDVVTLRQTVSSTPEEDEEAGMTGELLNEEMKATAKVVHFTSNRFVCLICGWKTKLKGFAISHVARCHDVERPYGCKDCSSSFFLPSRLQQHVRTAHRPGRYACPFCCFRSHYLGGFRRHCSRCNAREEGEVGGAARVGEHEEHEEQEEHEEGEEGKKTRAGRKRRMTRKVIEEQEEDE
ncbi:chromosome alignment-maintaining phosphoprotein 1-like isoform X2 [Hippoglossus hippoglossus]|uniref:chromosome alignment-maintaining phosphoprotein 1-like isoform X2 n=1 Tax=Hippoglossus hippoglossus TaxID=8267 RepID=UPI00148C98B7|nr:chromosome alignment-maintaining phosphoprotein 1-like isoform X2 [Hippoglossus hippoglossus]